MFEKIYSKQIFTGFSGLHVVFFLSVQGYDKSFKPNTMSWPVLISIVSYSKYEYAKHGNFANNLND